MSTINELHEVLSLMSELVSIANGIDDPVLEVHLWREDGELRSVDGPACYLTEMLPEDSVTIAWNGPSEHDAESYRSYRSYMQDCAVDALTELDEITGEIS